MFSSNFLAPWSSNIMVPNLYYLSGVSSSKSCPILRILSSISSCKSIHSGGKQFSSNFLKSFFWESCLKLLGLFDELVLSSTSYYRQMLFGLKRSRQKVPLLRCLIFINSVVRSRDEPFSLSQSPSSLKTAYFVGELLLILINNNLNNLFK